jgi:hypothetical protein
MITFSSRRSNFLLLVFVCLFVSHNAAGMNYCSLLPIEIVLGALVGSCVGPVMGCFVGLSVTLSVRSYAR